MNRTKKIQEIMEKNFNEFIISVTDDSLSHKGHNNFDGNEQTHIICLLYTSPSPRDGLLSRMPSSA